MLPKFAELQKEQTKLQNLLHQTNDFISVKDAPLFSYQQELDLSLQNLRDKLRARQEEVTILTDQEVILCETIGEKPMGLTLDPLPSASNINDFKNHLTELKNEKCKRENSFDLLRSKIQTLIKELEIESIDFRLK